MKAGSLRVLPTAATPEHATLSNRNRNFQELLRTFEIASTLEVISKVSQKKIEKRPLMR